MSAVHHQDTLMWSRVQWLIAIQGATLGGAYAVKSEPVVSLCLIIIGVVLTGLLYLLVDLDRKMRKCALEATGNRDDDKAIVCEPDNKILSGKTIFIIAVVLLLGSDVALGLYLLVFQPDMDGIVDQSTVVGLTGRDLVMLTGGFVLSFGAGALVLWAQHYRNARADKKKFSPVMGSYTAYPFKKGKNDRETDSLDYEHKSAVATISYERGNTLTIKVQHLDEGRESIWRGRVFMETPTYGTITWQYDKLDGHEPPLEHRFGFKRCIFAPGYDKDRKCRQYLYLIGEEERGYGREALEKNND